MAHKKAPQRSEGKEINGRGHKVRGKRQSGNKLARSMWKGTISFGLVNIPVTLHPAQKSKDIRFHILHAKDKSRIQEKIICASEQKEISRDDTVKGFEVSPGHHVIVRDKELESLVPKASRTIELIQFVHLSEIDPLYYDRPYYLFPEETARKAYFLLVEALTRSRKVGIAKFVMRKKEYLAALRPLGRILYLDTMHFYDEIVWPRELEGALSAAKVTPAELKMGEHLINSLSAEFEPEKLHDDYREALRHLIDQKVEGREVAAAPEEVETPQVTDLLSALEKSLSRARLGKSPGKGKSVNRLSKAHLN